MSYNEAFSSRKFSALVIDTKGRTSCITRFVRPLEPPQLNSEGFDISPEQCARYVSMIPFTEYNKFYENVCLTTEVTKFVDLSLSFSIPKFTQYFELIKKFIILKTSMQLRSVQQLFNLFLQQLLRLMVGSVLDHAIALTCYLLSLDAEAWLLLGFGIPHGTTAYVLLREHIKELPTPVYYIFDVVTGAKHSLQDIYCPLQKIFCLINDQNV